MCCQCWILLLKHKSKIETELKEEFQRAKLLPEASDAIKETGLCVMPQESAAVVPPVLYQCPFDFSAHLICPEQRNGVSSAYSFWRWICWNLLKGKKNPTSGISCNKAIGNAEMSKGHSQRASSPSHPIPKGALAAGAHCLVIPLWISGAKQECCHSLP